MASWGVERLAGLVGISRKKAQETLSGKAGTEGYVCLGRAGKSEIRNKFENTEAPK